jgi:hypothetical protein
MSGSGHVIQPVAPAPMFAGPMSPQKINEMRQMLAQQAVEIQNLKMECISQYSKCQHYLAVLINILCEHDCFKADKRSVRFPMGLMEEEEALRAFAVNTRVDEVTKDFVAEIIMVRDYELQMAGLREGTLEAVVPTKPPFRIAVEMPPGGTFAGPIACSYINGKQKNAELTFVPTQKDGRAGKPKKPREYSVSKDGIFHFTTDSAGLAVKLVFLAKAGAPKEADEADIEPLTCTHAWHHHENDGENYIGRACPECGDSRKILNEKVA